LDLTPHEEVKEYWDVLDFNGPAVQASYIVPAVYDVWAAQ
jgi:hypothetical protein